MTTSQVDNRNKKANLQRRKKKVDTQREIERRDHTTIKEQKKQPQFLALHISTPISRKPSHT